MRIRENPIKVVKISVDHIHVWSQEKNELVVYFKHDRYPLRYAVLLMFDPSQLDTENLTADEVNKAVIRLPVFRTAYRWAREAFNRVLLPE